MNESTEQSSQNSLAQSWLANILEEKSKVIPNFSLRSFSRLVGVSPAVLSRVLSGKRKLTFNLALKIADALVLNPQERAGLYSCYFSVKKDISDEANAKEKDLNIDCFNALKEWYHYGITQLLLIANFKEDHKWMAKMLNVSELEINLAIDRLLRLEILDRDECGKLYKTQAHMLASTEVASSGIRHYQKQILNKSISSLEQDDINERDITSITLAINEERIKEAKAEIKKFRIRMAEFLSEGDKTRVYNLGIHLIPLSKSSKS